MDNEPNQTNQEILEVNNSSGNEQDLNSENEDKNLKIDKESITQLDTNEESSKIVTFDGDIPEKQVVQNLKNYDPNIEVSVEKHSKERSNDVNQGKHISKQEQKKLSKLEKKENKKKLKQEKKQMKMIEKKENSSKKDNPNMITLNVSRLSWGIQKRGQITHQQTDEADWEDKMILDLEKKWKELESNQGTMMLSSLRQSVQMIWEKKIEELALHMDIPELIEGSEIVDENTGTMLYREDGSFNKVARVREMIRTLVTETEDESKAIEVISNFNSFKRGDDDIEELLSSFFKKGCRSYEKKKSPWLKIIKCVNKTIVHPAEFHIKKLFEEKYPYHYSKESWRIRISIFRDTVEIEHKINENAIGKEAHTSFKILWLVTIRIGLTHNNLDLSISILDVQFNEKMDKELKSNLKTTMQPFLNSASEYMSIFKKSFKQLNIHRDFPRLCSRLSIFKSNGNRIYTRQDDESSEQAFKEVILTLCKMLSPEIFPSVEHAIGRYLKTPSDVSEKLAKILFEDNLIPEDSKLAAILKCVNTTIVFPAINLMYQAFYDKIRFKDVRGTWNVHITFGPPVKGRSNSKDILDEVMSNDYFVEPVTIIESSLNENIAKPENTINNIQFRYVNIIHRKCEQSHSADPKDYFTFEWIVSITLNRELNVIKDAFFGIVDISFGPHTSDETKKNVIEFTKPYLRPSTLTDSAVSLDSSDLLDAAIQRIEVLEKQQHLINIYEQNLPHSLPLSVLLKSLKMSLPPSLLNSDIKIMKEF